MLHPVMQRAAVTLFPESLAALVLPLAAGAAAPAERLPLPDKILIAQWGEATALDGSPVIVGDTTLAVLSANQLKIGREEIPLDFEHGSLDPKTEPVPIAAYGTLEIEKGIGIWLRLSTWTPEGASYYSGRHYRDISPTVIRNDQGEIIGIHSVALTRSGQLAGLHAFSAGTAAASLKALSTTPEPETTPQTTTAMRDLLLALLGLPETATDEDITAAATAKISAMSSAAGDDAPPAEPEPMSARLDAIERRQILDGAKAAGKVIPFSAELAEKMELKTLSAIIDGLTPGQVPTAPKSPTTEGSPQPKALSADQLAICKQLGVSPARYREVNPD
jgi:phage I-like protein